MTTFSGTFRVQSTGVMQGDAQDDYAIRSQLRQGVVISTATQPMWGGLAISETMPVGGENQIASDQYSILAPATAVPGFASGSFTGWTVTNQSNAMITTAASPAPVAPPLGSINFYKIGSRARIAVAVSSAAASAWAGGIVTPQHIYWDTTNLQVTNTSPGAGFEITSNVVGIERVFANNCRTVSWNGSTSVATWNENAACVVLVV